MIVKENLAVFISIYFYTFTLTMAAKISANSGHQEEQSQGMLHGFQANDENDGDRQIRSVLQKCASDEIGKYDKIHRTEILRSVRSPPPYDVLYRGDIKSYKIPIT